MAHLENISLQVEQLISSETGITQKVGGRKFTEDTY